MIKYKINSISRKLLQLLEGISSWTELENKISGIEFTKEKGDIFEEFCKLFFTLTSKYKEFNFKNIWSFKDVPDNIRKKLFITEPKDYGIDVVIECSNGDLWTIQCKFRKNREPIPWRNISTFYASSKYAKFKIVFSNSHLIHYPLERGQKDNGFVLGNDLDLIEDSFFSMFREFLQKIHVNRETYLKKPFDYQEKIVEKSIKHYEQRDNGQLIMACGSGKTYVSLWVKEEMKPDCTIVFVPSLALMKQTFNEWTNQRKEDFYYSCVCSDKTVVSDSDEPHIAISEFGIPVTTNEVELTEFLKDSKKSPKVIFSTYQSTDVILKAIKDLPVFKFDFGVFDEAHKTSGKARRMFTSCLDVPINKRLFMTATPKIYLEYLRKRAKEEDIELFSMDDHLVYGDVISELKFRDAINKGILVDYKIKVIFVKDEEVKRLIRRCHELQIEDKYGYYQNIPADSFAKQIAIIRAMKYANRVISFHTTINKAKKFASEQNATSIPNTLKLMAETGEDVSEVKTFHISGKFPTSRRSDILKAFGDCKKSILSNARCLTEGVDCPAIDGVYFVDPKKSIIDIVQATGRAIRKDKNNPNKVGYIIISIFVAEDEDPKEILEKGVFKQIWKIVNAMKSQDERISEIIDKLKMDKVKAYYDDRALDKKEHRNLVKEFDRIVEVENIPSKFNKEEFIRSIRLKTVEVLGSAWFEWYQRLIEYNERTGKWPHYHLKGKDGRLGKWVANQRRRYREGILEPEKEELLKKINFPFLIWGTLKGLWMKNYNKLKKYKEEKGRWPPNLRKEGSKYYTKEEIDLGGWLQHQRYWHKKEKLSQERINLLNQIEGDWFNDSTTYHRDKLWEKQYLEFIEFRKKNPDRLPMFRNKEERKLHRWIHTQKRFFKKGKLLKERLEKLRKINFPFKKQTVRHVVQEKKQKLMTIQKIKVKHGIKEKKEKPKPIKKIKIIPFTISSWNKVYNDLIEFRKKHPDRWPIRRMEEYKLAHWCSRQRLKHKRKKLPKDMVDKLNEIGFEWKTRRNIFDVWFKEYNKLVEFKKKHPKEGLWPHSKMKNSNDMLLGRWVGTQRALYKHNKLEKKRIDLLNNIGFVFKPVEDMDVQWMKMYEGVKKFKEMNGRWPRRIHPPKDESTRFENKFGDWCYKVRRYYKNRTLSQEKIDLLNKINFDWKEGRVSNYLDDIWEKKYKKLAEFRKKYHRWPQPYNEGEKELHNFWKRQKLAYKYGQITPERIEKLKKIEGFEFGTRAYKKRNKKQRILD